MSNAPEPQAAPGHSFGIEDYLRLFLKRTEELLRRFEGRLAFLLFLVYLLPIWSVPVFPSQDGGAHLHTSLVLRDLASEKVPLYSQYYFIDRGISPYWTIHLLLMNLTRFLSPENSEKVVVCLCVAALFFGMRFALRSLRCEWIEVSWICLPLCFNRYLHIGLYNFVLSAGLFLFVLGLWLRHRHEGSLIRAAALTASGLVLFFTHVFFTIWLIGTIALWTALNIGTDLVRYLADRGRFDGFKSKVRAEALNTLIPLAPLLVLIYDFITSYAEINPASAIMKSEPGLANLINFDWIWSFGATDALAMKAMFWALTTILLIGAWQKIRGRTWRLEDCHLGVLAAGGIVYILCPANDWIVYRLIFPLALTAVLWAGSLKPGRAARLAFLAFMAWLTVFLVPFLAERYKAINEEIGEYLSGAPALRPGRTILTLSTAHSLQHLAAKVQPFRHLGSMLAAKRELVSLNNYEAFMPYLPLSYHRSVNPYFFFSAFLEGEAPRGIDLLSYPKRTEGRGSVDYIGLWVPVPGNFQEDYVREFLVQVSMQLQGNYELIHVSKNQKMRLFVRKDLAEETAG